MGRAALITRLHQQTIAREGEPITFPDGSIVKGIVKKLVPTTVPSGAPSGPAFNAANPATHVFIIAAGVMKTIPTETMTLIRSGVSYTIADVDYAQEGGAPVIYHFNTYRTPVKAVSADDADQEAEFDYIAPA